MQDDEDDEGGAAPPRHARRAVSPSGDKAGRSRNYSGPFRKTPDRLLGMGLIRLYQLTLSGFIGNSCRHIPTCSEYGYEAVARHGLWPGGWMALFRVARCGPGGTSGLDPVPAELDHRYHWWTPWRYFRLGQKAA
jgi:putative membrane protein insertion efficiency factor